MKHSFHRLIGDIISENITGEDIRILKDPACEPEGHVLPLYYSNRKENGDSEKLKNRRERIFTNVDLLILKENKIKVIIEIEESNVKPIHIFGKFFAAAFSSYYFHPLEGEGKIEMADSVLFIQILDTSNLKEGKTAKIEQWENIKKSIQRISPIEKSNIDQYKIFYGDEAEFGKKAKRREELVQYIKQNLEL